VEFVPHSYLPRATLTPFSLFSRHTFVAHRNWPPTTKYSFYTQYRHVNKIKSSLRQCSSNWHHSCFKEGKGQRKEQTINQIKENIMRTNTQVTHKTQVNAAYETSKFALGTGITMAALVGIWACACMISALASGGIGGVIKGFITAVTGA
jgi:hypothetical protein